MVAHHLCIDMVSWRIIVRDLGDMLEKGSLAADSPLSFRSWCALQAAHTKTVDPKALLPFEETSPNLDYWGAQGPLTYGKTVTETFSLGEDVTKQALVDCHKAFRSEPTELFLAAVAHAFTRTFRDRSPPTLHIENHGREAPDGSQVDLSQTVGWFTSICPLVIPSDKKDDALDTLRRTKDIRRSIPDNGRPYFARKHLGRAPDAARTPMEVLFNYLGGGVVQAGERHEHTDSLIRHFELDESDSVADVGPETRRLALFEITAMVVNGRLHFSFVYDSNLSRASDVRRWISDCKSTLEQMVQALMRQPEEPTLSDYPLLRPLTYDGLRSLTKVALPRAGLQGSLFAQIEDIYPCTPVQEGMLIGQLRDPSAYIFHGIYRVRHTNPAYRLDAERIARAWQKVVDRHAALRTVFVESVRRGGVFDQVVLRKAPCGAVLLNSRDDEDAMTRLGQATIQGSQLPHRLAICTTSTGRTLIKLEVNHAAIDGGSLAIILQELASAYLGTLEPTPGPLYSEYVRYIHILSAKEGTAYWMRHLEGLQPCYFPKLLNTTATTPSLTERKLCSTSLPFTRFAELRRLSEQTHVTLANIMHAAWGLVLRRFTGRDDVCFGYLTAGRDAPVEDIGGVVGTLINMLCCRVQMTSGTEQSLEDVFRKAQDQHLQSLPFQHVSLARVQHELGLGLGGKRALYNTSISTQSHTNGEGEGKGEDALEFEMEQAHDPSEVSESFWGE
jgi:non-ribosomal peptide synthase protein (TIGR01720 family)